MQVFTHNWDQFDVEVSSDRTIKLEAALAVQYEGGTEVDRFLKFSGYAAVLTPGMCILPLYLTPVCCISGCMFSVPTPIYRFSESGHMTLICRFIFMNYLISNCSQS